MSTIFDLQTEIKKQKLIKPDYKVKKPFSKAQVAPALFGIAGLTAVDAASLGLGAASLLAPVAVKTGNLSITSDKAERLLNTDAKRKLNKRPVKPYTYYLLFIGSSKLIVDPAQALIEVTWEGNDYGEIGGAYVRRNLKNTDSFSKSSLTVSFTKLNKIPPVSMKDPREWPIIFAYDGTYDPYGNGEFQFQGEFEINAFGGLKFNRHEVKSTSALEIGIVGSPYDRVKKYSNKSYTVPPLPPEQKEYLKKKKKL
jgi:hypothetical protein